MDPVLGTLLCLVVPVLVAFGLGFLLGRRGLPNVTWRQ